MPSVGLAKRNRIIKLFLLVQISASHLNKTVERRFGNGESHLKVYYNPELL